MPTKPTDRKITPVFSRFVSDDGVCKGVLTVGASYDGVLRFKRSLFLDTQAKQTETESFVIDAKFVEMIKKIINEELFLEYKEMETVKFDELFNKVEQH